MRSITKKKQDEVAKRLARILLASIRAGDDMPPAKWTVLNEIVSRESADIADIVGGIGLVFKVSEYRGAGRKWVDRNALLNILPKDTQLLRAQVVDAIMSIPTRAEIEVEE